MAILSPGTRSPYVSENYPAAGFMPVHYLFYCISMRPKTPAVLLM